MMDGKLFRQLRKDRGLRLQDVADEVTAYLLSVNLKRKIRILVSIA